MRTIFISLLWILPFISFLGGYQLLRTLTHTEIIEVPPVVGLHIHDAIKTLSAYQLNVRILAEKEDADLQPGTIISQTPAQGTKVKPHQSIFLVITRQPAKPKSLSFYGLTKQQATAKAQSAGITLTFYELESAYPAGTIFAQSIQPGYELADKTMQLLVSTGANSIRIMPYLKGHLASEVTTFFAPFGIKVNVESALQQPLALTESESTHRKPGTIIEQRPAAGTFIDLKKPAVINITVL